jgi:hypothetical protein
MRRYSPWSLSSVWRDACAIRALAYRAGGSEAVGAFTTEALATGRGSLDGVLCRQRRFRGSSSQRVKSVMEAVLRDRQLAAFDAVDQTMLAGNAPRPPAGEISFKGLGLAEPGEGVALDVLDQRIYLVAYPLLSHMFRTLGMCEK